MLARSRHALELQLVGMHMQQEADVDKLGKEALFSMCLSFNSKSPKEISQSRSGAHFSFTGPAFKETKSLTNWALIRTHLAKKVILNQLLAFLSCGVWGCWAVGRSQPGADLVGDRCCFDSAGRCLTGNSQAAEASRGMGD